MGIIIVVLLFLALICFIVAAIAGWVTTTAPRVNLIALGLAFWVATLILPHVSTK